MQAGGEGSGGGSRNLTGGYRPVRSNAAPKAMGDINVTPLVDVVLVLLLVFMITAPMMSRGIDVSLPVANLKQHEEDVRVTVSVKADGGLYLDDKPILPSLLVDQLHGMMDGRPNKVVYLRADETLRYGKVIEVVDRIKQAGVEQIGFVYVLPQEKAAR
jgi:biopolymer transport protein TolR